VIDSAVFISEEKNICNKGIKFEQDRKVAVYILEKEKCLNTTAEEGFAY
jgi:hypothetical protein